MKQLRICFLLLVMCLGLYNTALAIEDDDPGYSLLRKLHVLEVQARSGLLFEDMGFFLGKTTKAAVLAWKAPDYVDKAHRLIYFEEGLAFKFQEDKPASEALLTGMMHRLYLYEKLTYSKLKSALGVPNFALVTDTSGNWESAEYCTFTKKDRPHAHLKFYNDIRKVKENEKNIEYESTTEIFESGDHYPV